MLDASARQGISKPIRLVLVDRQPIVLQGLKSVLGTQKDFDVVASIGDGASCLEAIRNLSPDVALIADTLPDLTAADILAIAKAEKFSTRLVFFTESDNQDLTAAIAAGACSAISKYAAPGAMLRSLRLMAKSGLSLEQADLAPTGQEADGPGRIEKMLELLTPRERQIVRLVSEGMSNKEIARRLDVSQGTVKVHLHNIFQKLEITNRTVLATISWLQRTSGFAALALAFLAFAILDELKASEANDGFAHDEGHGQSDEHAGHEVWKKAILAHLVISKSGEAPALTEKDLLAKASQAATPTAAVEALRAVEQLLGSKVWKEGGSVGSGTPGLAALLPRGANSTPAGSDQDAEDHLPRSAFHPASMPAGYGTFAALAAALIYELSDSQHGAQARELDPASIDSLLAGIGETATTKLAAITHVDANHAANLHAANSALDIFPHDLGRAAGFATGSNDVPQQDVRGQGGPDAASHSGSKIDGALDPGPVSGARGDGLDQLTGGNVENVVHRSAIDSKAGSSDPVLDPASGPNRINLAAFGALACLHLTAAVKSIPPHTLAWIYDPATNQTIVYVNPTDRVLDVGDRGLLEVHLQGIVSVAHADAVHTSDGAAVAVTLEQLEHALISVAAIDETDVSASSGRASESSPGTAGVWSASADEGLSFQFAHFRTNSGTSAKSSAVTRDTADRTEESAGASGMSTYGSSAAPDQGATSPTVEKFSSKSESANSNSGAPSTTQNEIVPPGLATADSTGHGNSDHASDQGQAQGDAGEMTQEEAKPGNGVGNDNGHHSQAADSPPGPAKAADAGSTDHSHPGHAASDKDAEGESVATGASAEHGHEQHAVKPGPAKAAATEMAETKPEPDGDAGHDNEHRSQAADGPPGTKTAESGGAEHSHPVHSASAKGAEAGDSDPAPGNTDHGPSLHAAEPGSAKAAAEMTDAKSKPGSGATHADEHSSEVSDPVSPAGKTAGPPATEHGKPEHDLPPGSPNAAPGIAEPSLASGDNAAGGNPHQPPQSPAPEAQPEKSGFASSGADHELVFRFDSGAAASALAPAIEMKEPGATHATPGEKDAPQMIAEIVPVALDEHAANHGVNGPHHGVGPASHDWLI
ncbi:response regulator [Bradyrhizobium diazoefficiens]|nr:LuxR C-terminal-related transcriptional regulator [Bradyrhizobium diazoefficiens]MBR0704439.1 response regulator [Bradyrhizobium diazoefficiens]MBR0772877.1 response regulator [Bradyrhizobium diazoefficiens]